MNEQEIREHAERIIIGINDEYEFSDVYEDYELEDASEEDQEAVYDAMYAAKITVTWGAI